MQSVNHFLCTHTLTPTLLFCCWLIWLFRVYPAKNRIRPRVGAKKSKDAAEEFRQVADTICALVRGQHELVQAVTAEIQASAPHVDKIGRASCKERVCQDG